MKIILKNILSLLLFIPSIYAQKEQIKEAQKELKLGNSEQVIAILSPVEYLIINTSDEDKINFYYLKSSALVNLLNKNGNDFKGESMAVTALKDLVRVEQEASIDKHTTEAIKTLRKIKMDLLKSADEDLANQNFIESGNKFRQAYLIDDKDTLQLYNAAVSYKNANEDDLALKSYEELKAINYMGNTNVYSAYNKSKQKEEYFTSMETRDAKIKSGFYIIPRQKVKSKKEDIYKSLALIYVKKGYKEKALKFIGMVRNLNEEDDSLAILEANLHLETKEYELFDKLATIIIESKINNSEVAFNFGVSCQNEKYYPGAEKYYKKAIEIDPKYVQAYVSLSQLLIDESIGVDVKMNRLDDSAANKVVCSELKLQKEQIVKEATFYLQKAISIDPSNSSAKQLLLSINHKGNSQTTAVVIEE
jgi:tetratricopeptide (TPR) repeat protein